MYEEKYIITTTNSNKNENIYGLNFVEGTTTVNNKSSIKHPNEENIPLEMNDHSKKSTIYDLLDNNSIPYEIPSSDYFLLYSNTKQNESTELEVGQPVLYKSTKAYVTNINIHDNLFEDIIFFISNKQGKFKIVTNDILSLSMLLHRNISTTLFIPDNMVLAISPSFLQEASIQSNSKHSTSTLQTIDFKVVKQMDILISFLESQQQTATLQEY